MGQLIHALFTSTLYRGQKRVLLDWEEKNLNKYRTRSRGGNGCKIIGEDTLFKTTRLR
jgi:hypothetical protein